MVDAYDLSDPVVVLSKLPKGFDTDIKAAKWSERRDALLALLALLDTPKLADGSYEDLTNSLKLLVRWALGHVGVWGCVSVAGPLFVLSCPVLGLGTRVASALHAHVSVSVPVSHPVAVPS
jgi:hypothetical protein